MTRTTIFYNISDIKQSVDTLHEEGDQVVQETGAVGGGKLVGVAKDLDGNMVGSIRDP